MCSPSPRRLALCVAFSSLITLCSATAALAAYTPTQIRGAYGFDQLPLTGAGETIAIVDPYIDSTLSSDLAAFDQKYNLPAASLTLAPVDGGPTTTNAGWAEETNLDVQWAHAIAPGATIELVEATNDNSASLLAAANYAGTTHATVVSMSFGSGEFSTETADDADFTHAGVTYVAAAGDSGAGVSWPASSPEVVSVGGTTLTVTAANAYGAERVWSDGGGGVDAYEPTPAYQSTNGVNYGRRADPDVAYDADPGTGYYIFNDGSQTTVGGTSAGAPQWAALFALVDQARADANLPSLSSTQMLDELYAAYKSPLYNQLFHDITQGSNGENATTGYDLATGLGTPIANTLVPYLALGTLTLPEPAAALGMILLCTPLLARRRHC